MEEHLIIADSSRILQRLHDPCPKRLLKKSNSRGHHQCKKSFDSLKQALSTDPVLAYTDFNKPFSVATEASSAAFGAVLPELDKDRREYPIYFASRSLNEAEKDQSTYEREGLAIDFALKKSRH